MLKDDLKKKQFDKILGSRIKKYRDLRGLTLIDMQEITGYSSAYISYIERGVNTPSSYVIHLISQALNVSVDKLYPNDLNENNSNDEINPIISQQDFQEYFKIAKNAYLENINPKILDQAVKILNEN